MSKSAILSIRILSDAKQAKKDFADTASSLEKFESGLDKITPAAVAAVGGVVALGKTAFDNAARLQQSTGAVAQVFGDQANQISKFAKTAWRDMGLSQNQFNEAATILGSQLKNLGVPMDEVAGKTIDLAKLGADMAATFGGTTADAVSALSALLRGERDPIERYGISITAASVEAKKAELGLAGLSGAADQNATAMATMQLLTEQTSSITGQFAREADTASGAAERNAARWADVSAQLGEVLLPIMTEAAGALTQLAEWVSQNSDAAIALTAVIGGLAAAVLVANGAIKAFQVITSVSAALKTATVATSGFATRFVQGMVSSQVAASSFSGVAGTLGGAIGNIARVTATAVAAGAKWVASMVAQTAQLVAQKAATLAVAVAKNVAAVAQRAWNLAMAANPIGLIITLIIGAVGLIIANWEKIEPIVRQVWEAISQAVTAFWEGVIQPFIDWVVSIFVAHWENVSTIVTTVWTAISEAVTAFWEGVIQPFIDWVITVFVGYWTTVFDIIKAVWDGIIAAVQTVWKFITDVFTNVSRFIGRVFEAIGRTNTIIWNGIQAVIGGVVSWITGVANNIGQALGGAFQFFQSIAVGALNAVRNAISWVIDRIRQVADFINNTAGAIGKFLGFSAGVTVTHQTATAGMQLTAARLPALPAARLPRARSSKLEQNINISVNLPNYLGEKTEIVEELRRELAKAITRKTGVIA